jgi:hypothetical protein
MSAITIYRQARSNRLHLTKTCGVTRNSAYVNLDFELTAELADTIRTGKHVWCGRCATATKVRAALADIVADDFRTASHLYGDVLARNAMAARIAADEDPEHLKVCQHGLHSDYCTTCHPEARPVEFRIRNSRTGTTYLVLGTGPAANAPHLTVVWVQREGEQGAAPWNPVEMMSGWHPIVAVDVEGATQSDRPAPVLLSDVRVTRSGSKWYAECAGHQFASRGYVAEHAADLMAREHESEFAHWVATAEAK